VYLFVFVYQHINFKKPSAAFTSVLFFLVCPGMTHQAYKCLADILFKLMTARQSSGNSMGASEGCSFFCVLVLKRW